MATVNMSISWSKMNAPNPMSTGLNVEFCVGSIMVLESLTAIIFKMFNIIKLSSYIFDA